MIEEKLSKLIVILGPTASGKTDLAIELCKKFGGEVVNADSRQIYKEMDVVTGKPNFIKKGSHFYYGGIRHHLFDIAKPNKVISLTAWRKRALRTIRQIIKQGKIPFLVGGTGLYIQCIVENLTIPPVAPNPKLRESFEGLSTDELLSLLRRFDPVSADKLDPRNKRRIIRALEVSIWTGRPFSRQQKKGKLLFDILEIGMDVPREKLYKNIDLRVDKWMKNGKLVSETRELLKKYPLECPAMSGIGYAEAAAYLLGNMEKDEMSERVKFRTHDYARRQLTWFRRDEKINWIRTSLQAERLVKKFIEK